MKRAVGELARAWRSHMDFTNPCFLGPAALYACCPRRASDAEKRALLAEIFHLVADPRDAWDASADRALYEAFEGDRASLALLDEAVAAADHVDDRVASAYLRDVAARSDDLGASARRYLETVRDRVVGGYDVATPTIGERPAALLDLFRAAACTDPPPARDVSRDAAFLDERIAPKKRARAEAVLAEARRAHRVRDERALYCSAERKTLPLVGLFERTAVPTPPRTIRPRPRGLSSSRPRRDSSAESETRPSRKPPPPTRPTPGGRGAAAARAETRDPRGRRDDGSR